MGIIGESEAERKARESYNAIYERYEAERRMRVDLEETCADLASDVEAAVEALEAHVLPTRSGAGAPQAVLDALESLDETAAKLRDPLEEPAARATAAA